MNTLEGKRVMPVGPLEDVLAKRSWLPLPPHMPALSWKVITSARSERTKNGTLLLLQTISNKQRLH